MEKNHISGKKKKRGDCFKLCICSFREETSEYGLEGHRVNPLPQLCDSPLLAATATQCWCFSHRFCEELLNKCGLHCEEQITEPDFTVTCGSHDFPLLPVPAHPCYHLHISMALFHSEKEVKSKWQKGLRECRLPKMTKVRQH